MSRFLSAEDEANYDHATDGTRMRCKRCGGSPGQKSWEIVHALACPLRTVLRAACALVVVMLCAGCDETTPNPKLIQMNMTVSTDYSVNVTHFYCMSDVVPKCVKDELSLAAWTTPQEPAIAIVITDDHAQFQAGIFTK